jgi:hypothetical protein
MTFFSLTALRMGLFCSYFLMTLLALLIVFYLTNTSVLGMMGLKTLSFSKARNILRVILTSSTGKVASYHNLCTGHVHVCTILQNRATEDAFDSFHYNIGCWALINLID